MSGALGVSRGTWRGCGSSPLTDGFARPQTLNDNTPCSMTSMSPELVRGVVEKSIADLGVGYLDCFLVVRSRA